MFYWIRCCITNHDVVQKIRNSSATSTDTLTIKVNVSSRSDRSEWRRAIFRAGVLFFAESRKRIAAFTNKMQRSSSTRLRTICRVLVKETHTRRYLNFITSVIDTSRRSCASKHFKIRSPLPIIVYRFWIPSI